jgi:hypothetical protein
VNPHRSRGAEAQQVAEDGGRDLSCELHQGAFRSGRGMIPTEALGVS